MQYSCYKLVTTLLIPVIGVESNFETTSTAFVTTQGVPYDIRSIMHYGAYAFSRNRQPTIVPVDSGISLSSLGQRNGFTAMDIQHVNTLYCGCKLGRFATAEGIKCITTITELVVVWGVCST